MNHARLFVLLGILGGVAAVLVYSRRSPEQFSETVEAVTEKVKAVWEIPANGLRYEADIRQAAEIAGIPSLLLARLLYQESHFRDDIISGKVRSKAGAIGIAQFLPATAAEFHVDPYDPVSSIYGAARYLRQLYDKYAGDWKLALAAYNWGQGNIKRKGIASAPAETVNYYTTILKDTGL